MKLLNSGGDNLFNPTAVVAAAFGDHLAETYMEYFGGRNPEYAAYLRGAAKLVLERLGNTDALYHDAEHTIMVTLVGQQIMRGRLITETVLPEDWVHYTIALLVHDIGYARGVCTGDTDESVIINEAGESIIPPRGTSDAFLAPYHVDRGMIYAKQRFAGSSMIDHQRIANAIDFTRFPIPDDPKYKVTDNEFALVRAADLIGQLADPFYHRKITGLYYEFVENGAAEKLGYETSMDLVERYPDFFWSQVQPLIGPALAYLEQTIEGKQWIAQLNNHVFQIENRSSCLGPFPGPRNT